MKKIKICVLGLGYVGLPIAIRLSNKYEVLGYDLNKKRIRELNNKKDTTNEINFKTIKYKSKNLLFSFNEKEIGECNFYIITVPTPVDKKNNPDLSYLKNATLLVSKYLKADDTVVYESTTYPGCTDEFCIPILEKNSKLKINIDFFCGYSPERINPGDKIHSIENIDKIISSSSKRGLNIIKEVYSNVTKKKLVITRSIKIAESAKIIENTQRDINIALMNELSILFDKLNINFSEVLKAANTKWNFLDFKPGLVGGHCIGVDPYYLAYKSKKIGFDPKVILSGREVNDGMGKYVASKFFKQLKNKHHQILNKRILVIGLTFKENVKDIRNSKAIEVIKFLEKKGIKVDAYDKYVDHKYVKIFNINLVQTIKLNFYDGIIILVPHKYLKTKKEIILKSLKKKGVIFDFKDFFKNEKIKIHD